RLPAATCCVQRAADGRQAAQVMTPGEWRMGPPPARLISDRPRKLSRRSPCVFPSTRRYWSCGRGWWGEGRRGGGRGGRAAVLVARRYDMPIPVPPESLRLSPAEFTGAKDPEAKPKITSIGSAGAGGGPSIESQWKRAPCKEGGGATH